MDISVIIPVYNVAKYLRDCLDSVVTQKSVEIEIICIDDASTDTSLSILLEYASKYKNIIVLQNESNAGLSYARNRGLEVASGKYIYFLDSDDMIKPESLSELYSIAEKDNLEGIFFDTELLLEAGVDESVVKTEKCERTGMYNGVYTGEELVYEMYKNKDWIPCVWRQLWSRKFLKDNELMFINGIFHEDNPFTYVAIPKLKRGACVNKTFHIYRKRNDSITGKVFSEKRVADKFIGIAYKFNYLMDNNFSKAADEALKKLLEQDIRWMKNVVVANDLDIDEISALLDNKVAKWLLYSNISKKVTNINMSEHDEEKILSAESIVIYGAGNVAKELIWFCEKEKVVIEAITVTDISNTPKALFGHRIYESYTYFKNNKNALVVIAVKDRNVQADIKSILFQLGVKNIMTIA